MEDDNIVFSEVADYLDSNSYDEVIDGIQESDRYVDLEDWLEIDDINYRKF